MRIHLTYCFDDRQRTHVTGANGKERRLGGNHFTPNHPSSIAAEDGPDSKYALLVAFVIVSHPGDIVSSQGNPTWTFSASYVVNVILVSDLRARL